MLPQGKVLWSGPYLSGTLTIMRSNLNPANFFYLLDHQDSSLEGVHIIEDWQNLEGRDTVSLLLSEIEIQYLKFTYTLYKEYKESGARLQ
jgi:hypothetical protein